jgi:hypothetical protein
MHVPMIACSNTAKSMRNWMHVQFVMHQDIRSSEMTLVILMVNDLEREFMPS